MIGSKYGSSTYDRYKVITWINKQNQISQGEGGIGDNVFGNMPGAILEAQQLRVSNLNMRHGSYSRWRNSFIMKQTSQSRFSSRLTNKNEGGRAFAGQIKTAIFDPVYDGRTGLEYFVTEWAID